MTEPGSGWYGDPTGRHELRYWDGQRWTRHVSDEGVQDSDPLHDDFELGGGLVRDADGDRRDP